MTVVGVWCITNEPCKPVKRVVFDQLLNGSVCCRACNTYAIIAGEKYCISLSSILLQLALYAYSGPVGLSYDVDIDNPQGIP